MFRLSTLRTPSFSKAVVALLPARKPFNVPFDEQTQSLFFTKLPAEIRNVTYKYAFQTGSSHLLSVEAHPLSFLLTCRRVYHEASLLAFGQHTFPLSPKFYLQEIDAMSNLKTHLSLQQVQSITALSYDLGSNRYGCRPLPRDMLGVLRHAIPVFPNLKRFKIRLLRVARTTEDIHHCSYALRTTPLTSLGLVHRNIACKYLPHWFALPIFEYVVQGIARQINGRGKVELPQFEDDTYLFLEFGVTRMSQNAVGKVRGVRIFPCACGEIEWTTADIVQESGRGRYYLL
jgi:hypothetical protein